jgi:tetratricopeptide (TPR) repeat protein
MTTETAKRVPSLRWQVPVFIAGLAALAFVGFGRPMWHISDSQRFERLLSEVREALGDSPPNLKKAHEAIEAALNRADQFPVRLAEAQFLAGDVYSRLADRSPASEAAALWAKARLHLEEAAQGKVSEKDQGRFLYELGRARFHTGAPAPQIIDCLAPTVESIAEDRAEGYRMLTEVYLHLTPPNLQAALDANKKQIDLPQIDEKLLAPARLLRGKLFLQLHQPAEARKVLARIDKSTPGIYAEARSLRAQTCQQEKLFQEAAQLWEEALNDGTRAQPNSPDQVHYSVGECYHQLGRFPDAVANWEKAVQDGGDGAQAATLRLAETKLAKQDLAGAEAGFEKALAGVKSAGEYHNALLGLKEAQGLIEKACKSFRVQGDYERSLKMADLYRRLAPPEAAQGLIGEAADEWAKNLDLDAKKKPQALKVHREAGAAYEKAAGLARTPADQAKWLWLSGDRFRKAQDLDQAVAMLRAYLRVEISPESRGQGWLALGTIFQEQQKEEEAREAFFKCIECPGVHALRARYRLAKMHIDEGKLDDAELELKQNLKLLELTPDPESHEITLFMLADLYYHRGNFRFAGLRYQEALDQYPNNPATITVRWRLAECYRKLAQQETNRPNYPNVNQGHLWMQMAKANYEKLVDDLTGLQARGLLKIDGEKILHQSEFMVAECCFELEQFAEAARIYDLLADRERYRVDGLTALKQSYRCYMALHEPEKARAALDRLRETLRVLDDNLFKGQPDEMDRKAWLKWLEWAEKQLQTFPR